MHNMVSVWKHSVFNMEVSCVIFISSFLSLLAFSIPYLIVNHFLVLPDFIKKTVASIIPV